jgi:hypothetical protein
MQGQGVARWETGRIERLGRQQSKAYGIGRQNKYLKLNTGFFAVNIFYITESNTKEIQ